MTDKLKLIAEPFDFFRELVTEALGNQRIKTEPETEFYLVNLLNRFITTENLYQKDSDGHFKEEPLALMVKEALEQPERKQQELMFRQVGDVSLYLSGFFQDRLFHKYVDIDYYIGLGETAYGQVAERVDKKKKNIFLELVDKFSHFVNVLAEVGDKTSSRTEKDLIRTYEIWIQTKSDRAAKKLQEAGIIPDKALKKIIQ